MIEQVLNRELLETVLQQMESVARAPVDDDRRGKKKGPKPPSAAETEVLLKDIATAASYPKPPSVDRRSDESDRMSKEDRTVFIPGSPELSNLQSAIEKYFTEQKPKMVKQYRQDTDDDDRRRTPTGLAAMTGERLTNLNKWQRDRRLFGAFEQTDIRWINSLFAKGMSKFRGKHAFVPRPASKEEPIPFDDDNVRMIVFGDWGSGIPRAGKVAKVIREKLDAGSKECLRQYVIHLGDVYYSGWEHEYHDRLLLDWPVRLDQKASIGSFNLNGNHDMFSGGHSFYEYALADKRFAPWQGKSSLFHLANKHWQLFGLDTAWEDATLNHDQMQWLLTAGDDKRKTIFLSHHQYCSSYEKVSEGVTDPIRPALQRFDVAAWLWGHEHRCMKYRAVDRIRFPRCLGHAGVPVYQNHGLGDPVPEPGLWEYRDHYDAFEGWWAKFGFVILDFHGATIDMRYFDEDGREIKGESETIS
jgi:hypothetical protein